MNKTWQRCANKLWSVVTAITLWTSAGEDKITVHWDYEVSITWPGSTLISLSLLLMHGNMLWLWCAGREPKVTYDHSVTAMPEWIWCLLFVARWAQMQNMLAAGRDCINLVVIICVDCSILLTTESCFLDIWHFPFPESPWTLSCHGCWVKGLICLGSFPMLDPLNSHPNLLQDITVKNYKL